MIYKYKFIEKFPKSKMGGGLLEKFQIVII
jgi:hypothetical protein